MFYPWETSVIWSFFPKSTDVPFHRDSDKSRTEKTHTILLIVSDRWKRTMVRLFHSVSREIAFGESFLLQRVFIWSNLWFNCDRRNFINEKVWYMKKLRPLSLFDIDDYFMLYRLLQQIIFCQAHRLYSISLIYDLIFIRDILLWRDPFIIFGHSKDTKYFVAIRCKHWMCFSVGDATVIRGIIGNWYWLVYS